MMSEAYRIAELERRLANVLRLGTVVAVDAANARCRVQIDLLLTTAWLPWITQRAGLTASTWWAPQVGEQVMVMAPAGDLAVAVVLPAVYQALAPAPSSNPAEQVLRFSPTTTVKVNATTGDVEVQTQGKVKATATEAEVIAPAVKVTGNVTVTGNLTVTGSVTAAGVASSAPLTAPSAAIAGLVTAGTDVQAAGKSLVLHTHLYNPGPGNSTPTAPPT